MYLRRTRRRSDTCVSSFLTRTTAPVALIAILAAAAPLAAQPTVSTHRYDGARVGANLGETTLTASNVNVNAFGKLYSYPVDGSVYAQPLYIPGIPINGVSRNVLFVVTMNDKVYAFDADSSSVTPLWMRDFTSPPSVTAVPISDITAPTLNIVGNVGIQGTPVIDTSSRTMYFVARTKENGSYVQRLHALDITTGAAKPGSPVTITGSASGSAPEAVGGVVSFNPKMQAQRAALALTNGVVLIAWSGHEDIAPWHGWIMGYNAQTLAKVGTFCVTPDGVGGGIWQGGRAPTLDGQGNAYFATGNGTWDGVRNFGQSLLKFTVSTAGIALVDFFTPGNYQALNIGDDDLSGSGFTLFPNTSLMLGGGKEGTLYLVNAGTLGRMVPDDSQIPQRIALDGGHVMGGAVYWNSSSLGRMIYNWSEDDYLRAYRFDGSRLALPNYAQGQVLSPGHPGGSLTLSANGTASGTGIVWASMPTNQDGIHGLVAGVLRAFNAETLTEIWNSEQNPGRDRVGTLMKFVPPLVVNGRVYMPSHDNAVMVYGVNATPPDRSPATISIDFVGSNPVAMDAGEIAGVVRAANWNAAFGISSASALPLRNASGAPTSATATWSVPRGTWVLPIADQPGDARMMRGYLDTRDTSHAIVNVSGLPQSTYDVYVYVDGDNPSTERSAAYTISGAGITTTTVNMLDPLATNFAGTYTRADGTAGNYVRFTFTGTAFTVDATPLAPATSGRAPVNGIQIVPQVAAADFTIAASPASRSVPQGSSTTYSVSVGAVNGFTGAVSLSASGLAAGMAATFAPASISGSGASTMTVTTSSSTPAGSTTVTITGASGTLRHSTTVTLDVQPVAQQAGVISIDFVGSNPVAMDATEVAGVVPVRNWNAAVGIISSGPLALRNASGVSTSATVTWSVPKGTWVLPIADQPGDARMMRGYLDTRDTSHAIVTVAGLPQATYDVYVYADGDNPNLERTASYTISGAGITTTTVNLVDPLATNFAGTYTRADGSAGNYVRFTITASGFTVDATPTAPATSARAPVNGLQIVPRTPVPDFTIAASPASRAVSQGASATYSVTVGTVNGFTGAVSLSASGLGPGMAATFTPASISGSGTSTMTVTTSSSTPAGSNTLTITGTSGTLRHSTTVTVDVQPVAQQSGVISIDFVGKNPVAMDAAEVAGVVPAGHWNSAFGISSSAPLALRNASGGSTSATVTWSVPLGTWVLPIADQPGDARMMRGYLDTRDAAHATVTVGGLAQGTYDVYVYVDGDNGADPRGGAYTISGPGLATTTINVLDAPNTTFSGTFTKAQNSSGNYLRFTITGSSFTLEVVPTTPETGTRRAPLNGIQIVPATPASVPLPIGVDFTGNSPSVMAAGESAGVVSQTHWNSAPGAVRSAPLALLDASGAATPVSVTWTANGGWALPIADEPGNKRMMLGYLDTNSTSVTTVTVSGLGARSYDVYVYADGDNPYTRTATYRLSAPGSADANIGSTDPVGTNFTGTFVEATGGGAGNYVKFTVSGDSFTLSAIPGTAANGGSLRAPVNAIQIVPR